MTMLKIAKMLNRHHRKIKKEISNKRKESISKIIRTKKSNFKNAGKRNLRKKVISKETALTSKKILEKVCIVNVNREKDAKY